MTERQRETERETETETETETGTGTVRDRDTDRDETRRDETVLACSSTERTAEKRVVIYVRGPSPSSPGRLL